MYTWGVGNVVCLDFEIDFLPCAPFFLFFFSFRFGWWATKTILVDRLLGQSSLLIAEGFVAHDRAWGGHSFFAEGLVVRALELAL